MGGGSGHPKCELAHGGKGGGKGAFGHIPELVHPPGGPLAAQPPIGGAHPLPEASPFPLGHTAPIPIKRKNIHKTLLVN